MALRSSNPVLTHLGDVAARDRGQPSGQQYGQFGGYGYPQQYAPPVPAGRTMTLDDVVVRSLALLLVTGITAAASWFLIPADSAIMPLALFGSMFAGLALGLVIAFGRITNPILIAVYALTQGVLLGVVSRWFEQRYSGIVVQAVVGTLAIFFVMAALYKFQVLRATPRFAKFLLGALIAFVLLSFVDFFAYLAGFDIGLVDKGGEVNAVAFLFAAAGIVIGALTFILDFAAIEEGVRYGLPEKYAWYSAFGVLVGLIFLYWQVLRMLSYLRR